MYLCVAEKITVLIVKQNINSDHKKLTRNKYLRINEIHLYETQIPQHCTQTIVYLTNRGGSR